MTSLYPQLRLLSLQESSKMNLVEEVFLLMTSEQVVLDSFRAVSSWGWDSASLDPPTRGMPYQYQFTALLPIQMQSVTFSAV